jgi:hypothetical protein
MAGLIESMLAGGGQGAANASTQNTAAAQNMNLQQMQIEVRALMDDRVRENARSDRLGEMDAQHGYRMDEIKAMKDPSDSKIKEQQLKQLMDDGKVPAVIKTEYKSLDDSAKVIQAAIAKATAEGSGDTTGLASLSGQLEKIQSRQQEMLSSLPSYVAKKGSSLDDLFPIKQKPGQTSPDKTSNPDW